MLFLVKTCNDSYLTIHKVMKFLGGGMKIEQVMNVYMKIWVISHQQCLVKVEKKTVHLGTVFLVIWHTPPKTKQNRKTKKLGLSMTVDISIKNMYGFD